MLGNAANQGIRSALYFGNNVSPVDATINSFQTHLGKYAQYAKNGLEGTGITWTEYIAKNLTYGRSHVERLRTMWIRLAPYPRFQALTISYTTLQVRAADIVTFLSLEENKKEKLFWATPMGRPVAKLNLTPTELLSEDQDRAQQGVEADEEGGGQGPQIEVGIQDKGKTKEVPKPSTRAKETKVPTRRSTRQIKKRKIENVEWKSVARQATKKGKRKIESVEGKRAKQPLKSKTKTLVKPPPPKSKGKSVAPQAK
jgi:hypothetical protein